VLSGIESVNLFMESEGLSFSTTLYDGSRVDEGETIATATGNPFRIVKAEEHVIGMLSKPSGIATAARKAMQKACGCYQVVSGGWKKMPGEIKEPIRQAVRHGGIRARISEQPFVYLDKNYVRILGGVGKAIKAVLPLNRKIVIQVRGENCAVEDETLEAVKAGANVVMVDTGSFEDLILASNSLKANRLRSKVRLAFAGNLTFDNLEALTQMDVDIVDIGYAILDAPCLPIRFDVVN
jgi:nicotinate-nucleotide pyrophosphorylase (carboxylating)